MVVDSEPLQKHWAYLSFKDHGNFLSNVHDLTENKR